MCSRDLCVRCQEIHRTNLSVNYHDVVIYREKLPNFSKDEVCVIHLDRNCKFYCETCELPICNLCTEHRQHLTQDVRTAYEKHRQQHRKCIRIIRNDTLYNREVLLSGVIMDFKTCKIISHECQSKLVEKARAVKNLLDRLVLNFKMQTHIIKIHRYIAKAQTYEHQYENISNRSIQFILFLKKERFYEKQDSPNFPQDIKLTLADSVNIDAVTKVLSEIQMKCRGKRFVGNDSCCN